MADTKTATTAQVVKKAVNGTEVRIEDIPKRATMTMSDKIRSLPVQDVMVRLSVKYTDEHGNKTPDKTKSATGKPTSVGYAVTFLDDVEATYIDADTARKNGLLVEVGNGMVAWGVSKLGVQRVPESTQVNWLTA